MRVIIGYIDPGSGSLILQAVVAGVIGGLLYFRRTVSSFIHKLLGVKKRNSIGDRDKRTDNDKKK